MDLPDCPPGAEGYEDSVYVNTMERKPFTAKIPGPQGNEDSVKGVPDETSTEETKAEDEFNKHLNSLLINVEDGKTRRMVERRGRDVAGKWLYLCYPCAATCAGETVMQAHISGKKHKSRIGSKTMWPMSLFDEHPYLLVEKEKDKDPGGKNKKANALKELDDKYEKFRSVRCHIQEAIDKVGTPMLGLEYLVEHPPEKEHYEPQYMCTLCVKQGYPRTIVNHMTSFWHRFKYLSLHFQKVHRVLTPYRQQSSCREAVLIMINRLVQRIEEKFGRMRPLHIEKDLYEKEKDSILKWISNSYHISEKSGHTFEEVVDVNLIQSLIKDNKGASITKTTEHATSSKEPSPPVVAAPSRPRYRNANRRERRISVESLSDISDEPVDEPGNRHREAHSRSRPSPAKQKQPRTEFEAAELNVPTSFRSRYALRNDNTPKEDKKLANNLEYKKGLALQHSTTAENLAKKTLAYHEKNPEKHPLYPEEWKKFWNRRYKELQSEGKDPAKHDFKAEWIVYWTARMKELHQEELRIVIHEIYRKLCMTPPADTRHSPEPKRKSPPYRRKSPDYRRKSPDFKRKSPDFRRKQSDYRRKSPEFKRKSPDYRRKSPDYRRKSPDLKRKSPDLRRKLPESRRKSPDFQPRTSEFRRDVRRRSMERRRSPDIRRHAETRNRSPEQHNNWVPRSPSRSSRPRSRSPHISHSPVGLNLPLDSERSASPLSRREASLRNRSPAPVDHMPSMQTVLISDDELEDPKLSPWNSDSMDSLGSLPDARSPVHKRSRSRSVAGSTASRREPPRAPAADLRDLGPPENVVATLRLLVALEDYLGSLGPKIVDLLTEALKMEKEKANSSEDLLESEAAVVLMETAKEKLKGAVQAGLVASAAAAAVRAAVVRVAATLHEADKRARRRPPAPAAASLVPGVGQVDRAHIAQQMAAALIAQGRTDVSSEELAQLVDAVVGMAEAKKREALEKSETNKALLKEQKNTASALQMLQSAYDENDKKPEKDEAADAMDGLSDSDLETLLKNFNELSAEEQHSLIAYLKKLEAKEPQRVERLRQYVNIASTSSASAPAPAVVSALSVAPTSTVASTSTVAVAPATVTVVPDASKAVASAASKTDTVHIDSDDDDYTVEEVFNTAKQKVKESQIRQEMEIVKKSLEESKTSKVEPGQAEMSTSSASNLLAMVQASLQTISAAQTPKPTVISKPDVVNSNIQPRSFGDLPYAPSIDLNATTQDVPMNQRIDFQMAPMNQTNFNRNNTQVDQPSWDSRSINDNNTVPVDYGNNNADNNNWNRSSADWDNTNDNADQSYPSNNWDNALDNPGNNSDNWQNTSNNNWGNDQNNDNWGNTPNNDWGNTTNPNNNNWGNNPNPGNNNWGNNQNPNNSSWGNNGNSNWGSNNNNRGGNSGNNSWGNAPSGQAQANPPLNRRNDNLGQNSSQPYHNQNQRGNFHGGRQDNKFGNQNIHGRGNFRGGRGNFRGRGRGRPF